MKLSYPIDDDEPESRDGGRDSHASEQSKEALCKFCRFVGFHGIEAD